MRTALGGWWVVAAAMPCACGTISAQEQPAFIATPTPQSRAEIERIVSAAMNGQPVTIAADALTRDSVLVIQRRTPPGPQGRVATGRTLEAPEQFRLLLRDERCVLLRAADGREWPLEATQCVPAAEVP
jgi:hypothetical protein